MRHTANRTIMASLSSKKLQNALVGMLLCSLPFDYIPTLDVGSFTLKISSIIGALCILVWMIGRGRNRLSDLTHRNDHLTQLLAIWIVMIIVGILRSGQDSLRYSLPLLFLALLALSLRYVHLPAPHRIVRYVTYGAVVACLFGVYQYFGNIFGLPRSFTGIRDMYTWQGFGFPRMQSTFLEPLYFCSYLLLPLLFHSAHQWTSTTQKRIVLLGLYLSAALLTLSRGGLAALFVGLVILGCINVFYLRRRIPNKKQLLVSAAILLGVVLVFFGVISSIARPGNDTDLTYGKTGAQTVIEHLTNINYFSSAENKEKDDAINQRAVARAEALNVVTANTTSLLVGIGPGVYEQSAQRQYGTIYNNSGSVYLEIWLAYGLLGLILFISFVGHLIVLCIRHSRQSPLHAALAAYYIAFLFQANAFSGLAITHFWVMIGVGIGVVYGRNRTSNQETKRTT